MKKITKIAILLGALYIAFGFYIFNTEAQQFGAPALSFQRSLIPIDSTENVGTSTSPWDEGHFNQICLSADCKTAWPGAHDAVTVTDSSEIDFTLTGQNITASIIAGSIDETKLDTSVNASLDLADSALQSVSGGDHGTLSGLSDDDHTQYALLLGRSGGQTLIGGTASGNNLTLQSTSNATKGSLLFGTSAYDEVNNRLGIGTALPTNTLTFGATNSYISTDSADGADNKRIIISGGGVISNSRGAYFAVYGNEYSTIGGSMGFIAGNVSTGHIQFYTGNGTERMKIGYDGKVGIGTTAPNQKLTVEGTMSLKEQASANADTAAYGQLWVKTATPNQLWFTDDAGTDVQLGLGGGSSLHTATTTYVYPSNGLYHSSPYYTATSTTATSTLPRLSVSTALDLFGDWVNNIKDFFHFDKEITVCNDESCDYVTDGTADEVQINQALDSIRATGGTVKLYSQTYNLVAAVDMSGNTANSIDNPEIRLIGAGRDATILAAASNINAIELTDEPKFEIAFMTLTIAGTGDGINQQAGTERGNWQSSIHDIFIKTDFTTITSDSWGIYMKSPFRMTFENIEMNGVYNGMWLTSHTESFNPGNLSVNRIFIDLWSSATNGTGIKLSTTAVTSTGHMNLVSMNRIDIAGGSGLTGSIGIHLIGATTDPGASYYGEVRQNDFNSMNIEDVQTAIKLEAASDNTFTNINYTRVLNNGIVFDLDDESTNNKFENTYLDSNTASIVVNVINDQATDTAQPNRFERIVGFSAGTATLNATTSASTILKHIDLTEGSPTIDSDLTETDFFLGNLDISSATVTKYVTPKFAFPAVATTTTATSTVPLGSAYDPETWENIQCHSSSGTVGYELSDGTNKTNFLQATTTVSRFALTSNNSFTAQEKMFINVGPMTNSYITCVAQVKINP